jgi:hypothetical protein
VVEAKLTVFLGVDHNSWDIHTVQRRSLHLDAAAHEAMAASLEALAARATDAKMA